MIESKNTDQPWEKKAWFRMSKVIYYLAAFLALLIVLVVAYSLRPSSHTYTDGDKTIVACNNGKKVRNRIRYISENSDISFSDDIELKSLCKYGNSDLITALEHQKQGELPVDRNYRLEFYQTTNNYGSWEEAFATLLVGIPLVILVFEIIKRIFLYITIGKNPLKV